MAAEGHRSLPASVVGQILAASAVRRILAVVGAARQTPAGAVSHTLVVSQTLEGVAERHRDQ